MGDQSPTASAVNRGFRGLSSLVSEVDTAIAAARADATSIKVRCPRCQGVAKLKARPALDAKIGCPQTECGHIFTRAELSSGSAPKVAADSRAVDQSGKVSPFSWWPRAPWARFMLVVAGLWVLALLVAQIPTSSPSSESPATAAPTNEPVVSRNEVLHEEFPPQGTNLVLGLAQIRYCLAERIRLEAAKEALDEPGSAAAQLPTLNASIDDYNSR